MQKSVFFMYSTSYFALFVDYFTKEQTVPYYEILSLVPSYTGLEYVWYLLRLLIITYCERWIYVLVLYKRFINDARF